MLYLSYSERKEGEQRRGRPDQAAAEARMGHAATHKASQRYEPVKAHPRQKEDAAVHVGLLEKVHEGAEADHVVVALFQVKHLDQRVGDKDQIGHSQVHKVEVRAGQAAPVVQVDHQYDDVPNEANGEKEDDVEAGQEETHHVALQIFGRFLKTVRDYCPYCVIYLCSQIILSGDLKVPVHGHVRSRKGPGC